MSVDNNRLLLLLEKAVRDTNRDILNPTIKALKIDDLTPVLELVARARADYLKELFDVAAEHPDNLPSEERIGHLKRHRERYQELVSASQALETAIERKYLDVAP